MTSGRLYAEYSYIEPVMPEEARYEASGSERTQTIQLPVGGCRLKPRCIYQNVAGSYRAGKRTTLRMIVGLAAPTSGTAPRDGLPLEHGSNLDPRMAFDRRDPGPLRWRPTTLGKTPTRESPPAHDEP